MRTLVVSDLHLGCGPRPGAFAGAGALPGLLAALADRPLRVVLNGDSFDFVAQDDHLGLDEVRAAQNGRAIADDSETAAILRALAAITDRDGEIIVRAAEHDAELGLAPVQALLRERLAAPGVAARRVLFDGDARPRVLRVGAVRVVLVHRPGGSGSAGPRDRFVAKRVLNPLREQYGIGFTDLLKPDHGRATLAALAVNPTAAKLVLRDDAARWVWSVLRGAVPAEDATTRTLRDVYDRAGLSSREGRAFERTLDPDAPIGAEQRGTPALDQARLKVLRAAVADGPRRPLDARLGDVEHARARRLGRAHGAQAVIAGHTRAAAWRCDDGFVHANAGAWVWRLHSPSADAGADAWQQFLTRLQRTPQVHALRDATCLHALFTGVLIEPHRTGRRATVSLVEWRGASGLVRRFVRELDASR